MNRLSILWRVALLCACNAAASVHAAESVTFDELKGWWFANPGFRGESSPLSLHFYEKDGKPAAQLSLIAIGAYDVDLGAVTLSGKSIDTKPLSFSLTWNADRQTLSGLVPKDAAPVYDIPVEFTRSEPLSKPSPPAWTGERPDLKWSVDLGAAAWAGIERDAHSGVLYVGTEDGALHAIDARGKARWTFETGKPIRAQPRVIGEHVYVASDSGFLYKLTAGSGKERWRAKIDNGSPARIPTNQEGSRWDRYGSSVIADAKQLYIASRDKNLYALDIESGREIWRVTAGDIMTATPALYRDTVLFAAFDGKVQAVATRDGSSRWSYDAQLAVPGDIVVDGDKAFVGSRTYDLVALDAATGRELWKHYYWFSWIESPPVVRDGVAYTGSSDATNIYAINARDGSLRWKTAVPGWSWQRTAINEDVVVAGTAGVGAYPGFRSGSLVALDRYTGAIRWLFLEPPSKATVDASKGWGFGASPVIAGDVVYAVDLNGRVYAFSLGGQAKSRSED